MGGSQQESDGIISFMDWIRLDIDFCLVGAWQAFINKIMYEKHPLQSNKFARPRANPGSYLP